MVKSKLVICVVIVLVFLFSACAPAPTATPPTPAPSRTAPPTPAPTPTATPDPVKVLAACSTLPRDLKSVLPSGIQDPQRFDQLSQAGVDHVLAVYKALSYMGIFQDVNKSATCVPDANGDFKNARVIIADRATKTYQTFVYSPDQADQSMLVEIHKQISVNVPRADLPSGFEKITAVPYSFAASVEGQPGSSHD